MLSLFDGMACGMIAFKQLDVEVDEYHAYEIDKYAIQTSSHNFPEIIHHGDVLQSRFLCAVLLKEDVIPMAIKPNNIWKLEMMTRLIV